MDIEPRDLAYTIVQDALERDLPLFVALTYLGVVDSERIRSLFQQASQPDDLIQDILSRGIAPEPKHRRRGDWVEPRKRQMRVQVDDARWQARNTRRIDVQQARTLFSRWMDGDESISMEQAVGWEHGEDQAHWKREQKAFTEKRFADE
jgi:hypothetical protein